MALNIEVLGPQRHQVGESPLWSVAEQALYWVDIDACRLWRWDAASGRIEHWSTPERLACIALRTEGGLIGGLETQLAALLPQPGGELQTLPLASVTHPQPGMRFNDGRADRDGRFWAGTMVRNMALASPAGQLYRWDSHGLSAPLMDGFITPNGLAFSADGRMMYISDSHPSVQAIWRYRLDADGLPRGGRELFVDMTQHPGRPDGAAIDVDGCYWICGNDAGQVHRFRPDGKLDRSIALPISKPSMCSFGGPQLDQLFVASITPAKPAPGFDASLDGAVLVLSPGTQGLAERPCSAPVA
ncbi:SMP-30/gluconolactonase/LRE family protein [Ideonella azotifigens]|uniref:SMP-30/gluconolactonase/LRE family protein n=1 Tax=Ideonella azotifigens TaxID=513160 RepID=A0ABN1KGX3_9BURK|nr:SMP-30/gluconolactonase/LRE family protein [Ideonella azotifigens]MCD2340382.1 SMP-30/gluconolactonase/LRE family protein [Ideonella azotifigens]